MMILTSSFPKKKLNKQIYFGWLKYKNSQNLKIKESDLNFEFYNNKRTALCKWLIWLGVIDELTD